MALTKGDLQNIGKIMDDRLVKFHEQVTMPAMFDMKNELRDDIRKLDVKLTNVINGVESKLTRQIDGLERKLDQTTDHLAEKVDDHEERLDQLEQKVGIVS